MAWTWGFFVQEPLRLEKHGKSWFFFEKSSKSSTFRAPGHFRECSKSFPDTTKIHSGSQEEYDEQNTTMAKKGTWYFFEKSKNSKIYNFVKISKTLKILKFSRFSKILIFKKFFSLDFSPWWRNCFHPDFHSTRKRFRMYREVHTRVGARNVDGLEVFFLGIFMIFRASGTLVQKNPYISMVSRPLKK